MSKFYNPHRTRNLYEPGADKPFKLSRSKIDLYVSCPPKRQSFRALPLYSLSMSTQRDPGSTKGAIAVTPSSCAVADLSDSTFRFPTLY